MAEDALCCGVELGDFALVIHRHDAVQGGVDDCARALVGQGKLCGALPDAQFELISRSAQCTQSSTPPRSEEHTSELQSRVDLVCRLLLEKKKHKHMTPCDDSRARSARAPPAHGVRDARPCAAALPRTAARTLNTTTTVLGCSWHSAAVAT